MSSTTYDVVINLMTRGSLDGGLGLATTRARQLDESMGRAHGSAGKLGDSLKSAASSITNTFTGAVERIAEVGAGIAKIGAVAAGGALAYGVVGINNELEKTQISLAAIFGAQGITKDMNAGMDLAGSTMSQMRKDAAALPGETKDLVGIFKDISVPGFQAGANVDSLRAFAAKTMATSAVLGLPMEQMGREMAMLLEGRAGAHNVAGMRMAGLGGEKAQAFNKLSAPERLAALTKELDKFAPSIDKFSSSFEGVTSTLKDSARKFLGEATLPLFNRIKDTVIGINGAVDENSDKLSVVAATIGEKIAHAYDVGIDHIKAWIPAIEAFATHAEDRIGGIWRKIEPFVSKLEMKAANFLGDPAAFDKIESVLKLYAAMKIGGAVGGMVPGMMNGIGGLLGGGGGMGGAGGLVGALANPVGLITGAAVLVGLAETLFAVGGAVSAITDASSQFHDQAVTAWEEIQAKGSIAFESLSHAFDTMKPGLTYVAESLGTRFLQSLSGAATGLEMMARSIDTAALAASAAIGAVDGFASSMGVLLSQGTKAVGGGGETTMAATPIVNAVSAGLKEALTPMKTKAGGGGGGGGTTIQKVELVVNGSDDPSRVARKAIDLMVNISKYPTSSRFTNNFSAGR